MIVPVRLRLSRARGFRLQEASRALNGLPAAVVSRPGRFGNPFLCTAPHDCLLKPCNCCPVGRCCVIQFRRYAEAGIAGRPDPTGSIAVALDAQRGYPERRALVDGLPDLAGRNLACWCAPDKPCHADVLLELANPHNFKSED